MGTLKLDYVKDISSKMQKNLKIEKLFRKEKSSLFSFKRKFMIKIIESSLYGYREGSFFYADNVFSVCGFE